MPCASSRSSVSVVCASARSSSSSVATVGGIRFDELAREPELHRERDEMLLRAVVQVAFDLAPRLVGRRDDAGARRAEFVVGDAQVVERRLQRGVERGVVQRERDLAREVGEHALVLVGERWLLAGARAQHDAEQLAGVHERRDPQHPIAVLLDETGEPHLHPRVALRVGAGDHVDLVLRRAGSSSGSR